MRAARAALLVNLVVTGASAVGGGAGLVAADGLGMPRALLERTPFRSWTVPGVVLAAGVGGSHLVAAVAVARGHRLAAPAACAAGAGLMAWIAVQVAMIGRQSRLQPAMFAAGAVSALLAGAARPG